MAAKSKSAKDPQATVVRVKAEDTRKKTQAKPGKEAPVATSSATPKVKRERQHPLKAIGGYFKGAWQELRQVRWPNRRATWSMTAALLVFTSFFVGLILLLDALFKYVFQLILGS